MTQRLVQMAMVCMCLLTTTVRANDTLITKVSMNSDTFYTDAWHELQWDFVDIEDVESFDLSQPGVITIPNNVTRGKCSYQVGMSMTSLPNSRWRVKLLVDDALLKGSSYAQLPFRAQSMDYSTGLHVIGATGAWFKVEPWQFSAGKKLTVEVWVDSDVEPGLVYADSRSWLQCEWISSLITYDGFER